jgi:hypothetical protein
MTIQELLKKEGKFPNPGHLRPRIDLYCEKCGVLYAMDSGWLSGAAGKYLYMNPVLKIDKKQGICSNCKEIEL